MSKSRDIADSAATINYIDGLTSDAQTQLDSKAVYPSQTGNSGKYLTTDGSVTSWGAVSAGFTSAYHSCSNDTSITFSSIPAGVKMIFISFDDVRINSTERLRLQLGTSGGLAVSGYETTSQRIQSTTWSFESTTTHVQFPEVNANKRHGIIILQLADETNDGWAVTGNIGSRGSNQAVWVQSCVTLNAELTQLQIQTTGGQFAEGKISIQYL